MSKSNELIAAEWLVVGHIKCWSMQMLDITIHSATGKYMREFQFLPDSKFWSGKAQVRSYIAQTYPKLNAYLVEATAEKAIKTAEQITKLKWKGERPTGAINVKERKEIDKDKQDLRRHTTSEMLSRKIFKDHGKTNWNQCK
jgi:hypothetical protein